MVTHLKIDSAPYTLDVRMRDRGRARRVVETNVSVSLSWAVPLKIVMELPDDAVDLRAMLRAARSGVFAEWLSLHGYDQYGRGDGTFGPLI